MLDAILDLTAFRYSNFGRFLVCYSPPETVPETIKKPHLAIFLGFDPILSYIYPTKHQAASRLITLNHVTFTYLLTYLLTQRCKCGVYYNRKQLR